MTKYPKAGDLILLDFDPQKGHEITKFRPALVLSEFEFNEATGFVFVAPITSSTPQHGFHIPLPPALKATGTVKLDQTKSLAYQARKGKIVGEVPIDFLLLCRGIVRSILGDE